MNSLKHFDWPCFKGKINWQYEDKSLYEMFKGLFIPETFLKKKT